MFPPRSLPNAYTTQVVEADAGFKDRTRTLQLHNYFYGHEMTLPPGVKNVSLGGEAQENATLAPSSSDIDTNELKIYRVGEGWWVFLSHVSDYNTGSRQRRWLPPPHYQSGPPAWCRKSSQSW